MKYKVGDRVRVRQWEDMEREFGLAKDGFIKTGAYYFNEYMRDLCGEELEIIECGDCCYMTKGNGYRWTESMFEPLESKINISDDTMQKICHISEHYSKGNQLRKALEELQELRSELLTAEMYDDDFVTLTDNTISECADVIIMCLQIAMQHGKERELTEQIEYKVNRQIGRMESESISD